MTAVDLGATAVRVAGRGRVVQVVPDPAVPLHELLAGLVDDPAAVECVGGPPDPAVLVAGPGERVVVDLGHRATRVTLVRRGTVRTRRTGPGGADLDRALARWWGCPVDAARQLREELSLHPTADGPRGAPVTADEVDTVLGPLFDEIVAVVTALAAGGVPVLLVGGGARSPRPAELLDRAGLPDVVVAAQPDTAVVRAAAARAGASAPRRARPGDPAREPVRPWLGEPRPVPRRPARALLAGTVVVAVLAGLHLLGASRAPVPPSAEDVVAQYGYRFELPPGWAHTGGEPQRRRSLLTPLATPEGSDLIAVEATPLGFDADAEPRRAAAELRAEFDAQVAAGARLRGYRTGTGVAGRQATTYQEDDDDTTVRWFVLLEGGVQLSVGCRATAAGETLVEAACARVAGSVSAR